MRVAHCVGWYAPDSIGGSEVYVESLVRALRGRGVDGVVLAPRDGDEVERHVHDGTEVLRYPVPPARDRARHEGLRPHHAFERFGALLQETRADVFHLHSLTYGANAHHLEHARALGMAAVTTLHLGAAFCERGTLLHRGREACDGRIDPRRCVPCWMESKGVRAAIANPVGLALSTLPAPLAALAPGRLGTLVSSPARVLRRREVIARLAAASYRIVTICDWIDAALRVNGVAADKLMRCGQGVDPADADRWGPLPDPDPARPLRIAFFGRADPVKGLDTLVDAVLGLSDAVRVRLAVHVVANRPEERRHLDALRLRAAADARIAFRSSVAATDMREEIRKHDVLAVPSRVLETGPRVVLEALAAGIPVLGSDLGGIRELVVPGRHGWLLPHDDVARWRDALARLARERPVPTWSPDEAPVLTHDEVARRHALLYQEAVA